MHTIYAFKHNLSGEVCVTGFSRVAQAEKLRIRSNLQHVHKINSDNDQPPVVDPYGRLHFPTASYAPYRISLDITVQYIVCFYFLYLFFLLTIPITHRQEKRTYHVPQRPTFSLFFTPLLISDSVVN
jgi:hypothetical protein